MNRTTFDLATELNDLLKPMKERIEYHEMRFAEERVNIPVNIVIDKTPDSSVKFGFTIIDSKWKLAVTDPDGNWLKWSQAPMKYKVLAVQRLDELLAKVDTVLAVSIKRLRKLLEGNQDDDSGEDGDNVY